MSLIAVTVRHQLGAFRLDASFRSTAQVTVLFGRSGCGKSSLIRVLAGLLRPTHAEVRFNGTLWHSSVQRRFVSARDRRVGWVAQDALLFPHLSVRANLVYGQWFSPGVSPTGFAEIIDLLGLQRLLDRSPGSLSGGERQRVALGRALLRSPALLLLDEPLAALDEARKTEVLDYLARLKTHLGLPMVYVTHSMDELLRLGDQVVVMDDGRVRAAGTINEVLDADCLHGVIPDLDHGRVIDCVVHGYDARYDLSTLRFPGGELRATHASVRVGELVRVRIRARDVTLIRTPPHASSALNVLAGRIIRIAPSSGAAMQVSAQVGEAVIDAQITAHSCDALALRAGEPIHLMIKAVSLDRAAIGLRQHTT